MDNGRIKKYRNTAMVVFSTLIICSGLTAAASETLDGFRDLPWGSTVEDLKGGKKVRVTSDQGGTEFYVRDTDPKTIGQATGLTTEYCYWQGKLARVSIISLGETNFDHLMEVIKSKYGEPEYFHGFYIFGARDQTSPTSIGARYNRIEDKGTIFFSSRKYETLISEYADGVASQAQNQI